MRILANENFPEDAVTALQQDGHDVVWIRADAPGSSDQQVLEWAQTEDRILIIFDKILVNWLSGPDCSLQVELFYFVFQPHHQPILLV